MAWSDDDTIWFGTWDFSGALEASDVRPGLYQVSATGGVPRLVTAPEAGSGVIGYVAPRPLPNGRGILYHTQTLDYESSIGVYVPETDEHRTLARGRWAWFAASGHVVFSDHETQRRLGIGAGGVLWALPFDLDRLEPTGEPVRVREGVYVTAASVGLTYLGRDGTLIYVAGARPDDRTLVLALKQAWSHHVSKSKRINPHRHVRARRVGALVDSGNSR